MVVAARSERSVERHSTPYSRSPFFRGFDLWCQKVIKVENLCGCGFPISRNTADSRVRITRDHTYTDRASVAPLMRLAHLNEPLSHAPTLAGCLGMDFVAHVSDWCVVVVTLREPNAAQQVFVVEGGH